MGLWVRWWGTYGSDRLACRGRNATLLLAHLGIIGSLGSGRSWYEYLQFFLNSIGVAKLPEIIVLILSGEIQFCTGAIIRSMVTEEYKVCVCIRVCVRALVYEGVTYN